MANLPEIELPLFDAFTELMQLERGQPVRGVDPTSYLLLIEKLREGFFLNSEEELIFVCEKLWLKPGHKNNPVMNAEILKAVIVRNLQRYGVEFTNSAKEPTDTTDPHQPKPKEDLEEKKTPADIPTPARPPSQHESENRPTKTAPLSLGVETSQQQSPFEQQDFSNLFPASKFEFNYEYLPVSPRFIEQTVRSLRYKMHGAGRPLISIMETVKDTASKGFFDNWKYTEEDEFITKWTLLLDRGGSMIAFHALQDAIIKAAFHGTVKNEGDVFYFRNVATDTVFTEEHRMHGTDFDNIVQGPKTNILIISDAGAAKRSYNRQRVAQTYQMLYKLRRHRIAWLNPLPKTRWQGTTAASVARIVNMFEPGTDLSDDFGNIVRLFRSKINTTTQF